MTRSKHVFALPGFAPYLILIAAVFAAYANVYGNAFLLDDEQLILNNALLRSWNAIGTIFISSGTSGAGMENLYYRPLQTFLYLIVYQLSGFSTAAFHLLNVTLHVANACLLYALGRKLGFKPVAVLLGALIWALHPIQTEAVAYMSATADTLHVFFCLLGLLAIVPGFAPRDIIRACPFYLMAMLSKETAIIFPLLAMCCQYLLGKNRFDPKFYLRTWPLWLIALLYLVLRHFALGNGYTFYARPNIYTEHIAYRIYTFLATLPAYAQLLIWPSGLHMDRNFPVYTDFWNLTVLEGALMSVAALGQIAWGQARRGLALSWGFLWFGSAYALYSGIVLPVNGIFFEHWMYLPTAGLFLGLAQSAADGIEALPHKHRWKQAAGSIAIITALACGAGTFGQNAVWRDPVIFYTYLVRHGARAARVHNNLGNAYIDRGAIEPAIRQFKMAIGIDDHYPQTHHNLALAYLQLPDRDAHLEEAIAELRHAVAMDPAFFQSWELLANIYAYKGDRKPETECRAKAAAIRQKFGIPPEVYAQPVLAPAG